jgi:flavin-dependent dehydrogenase
MMSASDSEFDVAIVGAGPAGGAAALELVRAGQRVLLLEKRQFPREKVCGGCLSGLAMGRLRSYAGDGEPLPGIPALRLTFVIGSCRLVCDSRGKTRIVLRPELDGWLAARAAAAGADVRFGQTARLVPGAHSWDVATDDRVLVRARVILLACGLSTLPRTVGIARQVTARRMVAQQWIQPATGRLPRPGCVEMHWLRGGYVGLATHAADCCVVALAADVPHDAHESVWLRLRRLNPNAALWSSLAADAPRRYGARGTAGFPWMPDRLGVDNVLLIGDAAGYEEPFTGEGMGQAMRSATCATRAILGGGDLQRTYADLMLRNHRPSLARVRRLGQALRNPIVRTLADGPALLSTRTLARLVDWVHVRGAA